VERLLHLGGNAPLGEFFDHVVGPKKADERTLPAELERNPAETKADPNWAQHELDAVVALNTRIVSTSFEDFADEARSSHPIAHTVFADGTFDWATTPARVARVVAMLRERMPAEQVLLLLGQSPEVRDAVRRADGNLTTQTDIGPLRPPQPPEPDPADDGERGSAQGGVVAVFGALRRHTFDLGRVPPRHRCSRDRPRAR
jgi:hypothetical protein